MEEEGIKIIVVTSAVAIGIIIILLKVIQHFTEDRGSLAIPLLFLVLVGIIVYMYMGQALRVTRVSGKMEDAKRTINSLFFTARAVAKKHYRCAGVRFQQTENGEQYAILITQEPNLPCVAAADDPNCIFIPFVAMAGRRPVSFGSKIAIASKDVISNKIAGADCKVSIVFSPAGTLTKRWVMMKANPNLANSWLYGSSGLFGEETAGNLSNMGFCIYKKEQLEASDNKDVFFRAIKTVHIKPDGVAIFR